MAARDMKRIEINIHEIELCVRLFIYKDYNEMHGQQNTKLCVCVFVRQSKVICSQQRVVLTKLYQSQTSNSKIIQLYLHVSWVTSEIESGKTRDKMRARCAKRLLRYPRETTQMRNKLLVPRLFFVLGNLGCCAVWLGSYLSVFRTNVLSSSSGLWTLELAYLFIHPFSCLDYDSP
jgi:hypothetical protein